jgi:hypothetical protein
MADKKYDHMGDQSGQPVNYKFNKALDDSVKAQFQPMFNPEGEQIVMEGAFKARRDAQMKRRKAQGK